MASKKATDIDHDGSYRKLFSDAAMVRDLLKWDYIPSALTADILTDAPMAAAASAASAPPCAPSSSTSTFTSSTSAP